MRMGTRRAGGVVGSRRWFLRAAASTGGLVLAGCATGAPPREAKTVGRRTDREVIELTPGEDLMQEHGVLARVLLVYDVAIDRIEQRETLDLDALAETAQLVRQFVEDYHERLEEEQVFPRLVHAGREVDLVAVLRHQHRRGRELTDEILRGAASVPKPELVGALRSFICMYWPHAAHEDTVLFPAFRRLVGPKGYLELAEAFRERERNLLGRQGFLQAVATIARIEAAFGIHIARSTST
jgi:hemerythrin-like domain-containing protein